MWDLPRLRLPSRTTWWTLLRQTGLVGPPGRGGEAPGRPSTNREAYWGRDPSGRHERSVVSVEPHPQHHGVPSHKEGRTKSPARRPTLFGVEIDSVVGRLGHKRDRLFIRRKKCRVFTTFTCYGVLRNSFLVAQRRLPLVCTRDSSPLSRGTRSQ